MVKINKMEVAAQAKVNIDVTVEWELNDKPKSYKAKVISTYKLTNKEITAIELAVVKLDKKEERESKKATKLLQADLARRVRKVGYKHEIKYYKTKLTSVFEATVIFFDDKALLYDFDSENFEDGSMVWKVFERKNTEKQKKQEETKPDSVELVKHVREKVNIHTNTQKDTRTTLFLHHSDCADKHKSKFEHQENGERVKQISSAAQRLVNDHNAGIEIRESDGVVTDAQVE